MTHPMTAIEQNNMKKNNLTPPHDGLGSSTCSEIFERLKSSIINLAKTIRNNKPNKTIM